MSDLARVVLWIGLGLALGVWIAATQGAGAAAEYYAAYFLEESLSVDNIFVFVVIFRELHISVESQHRVLRFGVAGALVFRALMIVAGIALIERFHWIMYPFAALIFFAAWRVVFGDERERHVVEKACDVCETWVARVVRVSPRLHGHDFWRREDGRLVGAACASQETTTSPSAPSGASPTLSGANAPPLYIKSLGVNLGSYDSATGKAGDFKFTNGKLQQNRLWMDYGHVIPGAGTSTGQDKANPQPTFILPMGTKVRSLVDGVVVGVPELYSHDFSILVASDEQSPWRYETEHVRNPLVRVGDRVTAGQIIAEVSDWSSAGNDGLGMVEIGLLKGGNPPQHFCPFQYLDPSVRTQFQDQIRQFYSAWESYKGDTTLYDEASMPMVGCRTLDPVD